MVFTGWRLGLWISRVDVKVLWMCIINPFSSLRHLNYTPHQWPVTLKMLPFDDVIMHWCVRQMLLSSIQFERNSQLWRCQILTNIKWRLITLKIHVLVYDTLRKLAIGNMLTSDATGIIPVRMWECYNDTSIWQISHLYQKRSITLKVSYYMWCHYYYYIYLKLQEKSRACLL